MTTERNPFGARGTVSTDEITATYYSLRKLEDEKLTKLDRLPYTVKVLLENVLRNCDSGLAEERDVSQLGKWRGTGTLEGEFPFMPARVLLQDFTGVPAVVDLAAMR